jgi:hypothetical protein
MAYEPRMTLSKHYSGPSWRLTEEAVTEMNGMMHLTAKKSYRAQMKIF